MRQIPLSQGKFAIVDDEDYVRINQCKWYFEGHYAIRKINLGNNKWKTFWMHREIMRTPEGMETDHINSDKLDNRKINLRVATRSQNQHNRKKYANNKTGFKGVSVRPDTGKFRAIISLAGRNRRLGQFETAEQAANAYDAAALKIHKDFARLNS